MTQENYLYRHYAADNTLLYVGISLSATYRLAQHRQSSEWFGQIARVDIEKYPTRADALQAETKAIQTENPKYNVVKRKKARGPSMEDMLFSDYAPANATAVEVLERVVRLNPMYTIAGAADCLGVKPSVIRRLIESRRLSHIVLPSSNPKFKPKTYVTGWQIIEFLENEERNADDPRLHV